MIINFALSIEYISARGNDSLGYVMGEKTFVNNFIADVVGV